MPLTHYATPLPSADERDEQAWSALTAIANGLSELDAQLLYGFTKEELAAFRVVWEQRHRVRASRA